MSVRGQRTERLLGVPVDVVTDGGLSGDHPIVLSAVAA